MATDIEKGGIVMATDIEKGGIVMATDIEKDEYIKYLEGLNIKHVEASKQNSLEYQKTFRIVIIGTLITIAVLFLGTLWIING